MLSAAEIFPDLKTTRVPSTSASAMRVRKHRERQASGKTCVMVELDAADIEVLIEARVLDAGLDHFSRKALAQAVKDFFRLSRWA